jgi:hypothetical protein
MAALLYQIRAWELQPLQPQQKLQQTIRDHESRLRPPQKAASNET